MLYNYKMNGSIILASGSPRRVQLLSTLIDDFEIVVADVDESVAADDPVEVVTTLAKRKANAVNKEGLIIAADTIVYDDEVLGKPANAEVAVKTLLRLSGRTHFVYTGVCLKTQSGETTFYDSTAVTFKKLTEEEIREYVATFKPLDKAGSYGVQDGVVVEKTEGSFSNVVGLPLEKLKEALIALGVSIKR